MKTVSGVFLLVCMPLAVAKSDNAYPKEKVWANLWSRNWT